MIAAAVGLGLGEGGWKGVQESKEFCRTPLERLFLATRQARVPEFGADSRGGGPSPVPCQNSPALSWDTRPLWPEVSAACTLARQGRETRIFLLSCRRGSGRKPHLHFPGTTRQLHFCTWSGLWMQSRWWEQRQEGLKACVCLPLAGCPSLAVAWSSGAGVWPLGLVSLPCSI